MMQLYQVSKTLLVIGKNLALEGCARTVQCHVMSFNSIMHHMIIYCQTLPSRKHSRYARELNKLKIILQSVSATDVVCSADIMRIAKAAALGHADKKFVKLCNVCTKNSLRTMITGKFLSE